MSNFHERQNSIKTATLTQQNKYIYEYKNGAIKYLQGRKRQKL